MKVHVLIVSFVFSLIISMQISLVYAQSPQLFNYQGIARDAAGNPLSNKTLQLRIGILPAQDAAVADYEEEHLVSTNEFGLYSLQVGNGQALSGSMNAVRWDRGNKYIRVAVDQGQGYTELGTSQLLSVPYALYADKAGMAQQAGEPGDDKTRTGSVNSAANHAAGDVNYLSKFTALNVIGKSQVSDNGSVVGIGSGNFNNLWALHIKKTSATYLTVQADANNATAAIRLQDNGGTTGELGISKFGANASGTFMGIPRKGMGIINNLTGPFVLNVGGYSLFGQTVGANQVVRLMIDSATGYTGINTTIQNPPTRQLDVNGQIRIRGGNPGAGKVLTSDSMGVGSWQPSGIPAGNNTGDMQYWNGTQWVIIPVGLPGQTMTLGANGLPTWSGPAYAVVITSAAGSVDTTSAIVGGVITYDGGSPVTDRGVVYSVNNNPTLQNASMVAMGNGTGSFSDTLIGLNPNTTYYFRAYAINGLGTQYGVLDSFISSALIPQPYNLQLINLDNDTAIVNYQLAANAYPVLQKGIVYSLSPNPTLANGTVVTSAQMQVNLTGLVTNQTHYARAFATNANGTGYSNLISFNTYILLAQYGGGRIFLFTDSTHQHGYVAAETDIPGGGTWGCNGQDIVPTCSQTSGESNTLTIVNSCADLNTAARLCYDLNMGGYSDWFLASYYESDMLFARNVGNIFNMSGNYWTSNAAPNCCCYAYAQAFPNGGIMFSFTKNTLQKVRPIRTF